MKAMRVILVVGLGHSLCGGASGESSDPPVGPDAIPALAAEVRGQGWIAYSARSDSRDWEIFLMRPDGSGTRNLTRAPASSEFSPQFSRDGRRLLYRRVGREEKLDNNRHGEQGQLVVANSDGTEPRALGKAGEFPWASWNPDGRQIACLSIRGIFFVEVESQQVVRRLPRAGFFQQMTWSPDGKWLSGVANSFGASWSVARLEVATGRASAVHRVDCCTPDWFPDTEALIFSWRPRGQRANNGYGWTQLWRVDVEGKSAQLVYGEEGRHIYGGHVSPDGRYVLFTGNMEEDGDPGNAGAPMALMRLRDGPIIGGASPELRGLHPRVNDGPVLTLPPGWEPCWTFSELPAGGRKAAGEGAGAGVAVDAAAETVRLGNELSRHGWIIFSAKTERGDWDLFLMRPDGSDRRRVASRTEYNEAGARFSPDGQKLLYYRMPKSEPPDNNTYGTFDLVLVEAGRGELVVQGRSYPWASWGPDSKQLACLTGKGIEIVEVATGRTVRRWPRLGMVSQLVWAPDGEGFVGTANGLGPFWNVARLNPSTGQIQAVSETERYNCTPDWMPDGQRVLYARGIVPEVGGRAELWAATADGKEREMCYAEAERHIYGACACPDGQYLVFTRSAEDLGTVDHAGTALAVIRWADRPMIGDEGMALQKRYPDARRGPRLDLGPGWEPHWTLAAVDWVGKGVEETMAGGGSGPGARP